MKKAKWPVCKATITFQNLRRWSNVRRCKRGKLDGSVLLFDNVVAKLSFYKLNQEGDSEDESESSFQLDFESLCFACLCTCLESQAAWCETNPDFLMPLSVPRILMVL